MSKKKHGGPGAWEEMPDAKALLEIFRTQQHPLWFGELLSIMHLPGKYKRGMQNLLQSLVEEGHLVRLRGNAWAEAQSVGGVTGRYSVLRNGIGFVTPAGEKIRTSQGPGGDILIRPEDAHGAWPGDLVRVMVHPGHRGRYALKGRVLEVLERGQKELAVHVVRPEGEFFFCKPADPRFPIAVQVQADSLPQKPGPGELLLVILEEQLASNLWRGTARCGFGREDDVAVQEHLVKLNHQVPMEFPAGVMAEAVLLPENPAPEDMAEREDLRDIPFVTIDGEDARDFDDAVHVRAMGGGWLLRVAIADVAHYVRPGSALDKEALERGNSWYFPASVEPMLPEALSNGLCSLKPGVDRLVMLVEIPFTPNGQPGTPRFAAGVIRSAARLTYTQVQQAILKKDAEVRSALERTPRGAEVLPMLEEAERLAHVLANVRKARGSLDFDMPEAEYVFDAAGRVQQIRHREHHFGHKIIEEFMIATNEAVARFLEEHDEQLLYRTHPEPEQEKLRRLFRTLSSTALATILPDKPGARDVQAVLRAARGGPQEFLVGRLVLRTMPQACYQVDNEGHFGLASTSYCHFTSPIRRYADITVHRQLRHALGYGGDLLPNRNKLRNISYSLNKQERAAMEAEREITRRMAALALRDRVGECFEGTISGVMDFGLFVELDVMPVEGMVRIATLGDEYFEYDQDRQELIGVLSGLRYRLGQRVKARLTEVHVGRLEITMELTDMPQPLRKRPGERRGLPPRRRKNTGRRR